MKLLKGAGRMSRRGCRTNSPSYWQYPVSSPSKIISADSAKRARDWDISTPNPSNSTRPNPRPMPRMALPPLMLSSMDTSSATRMGSCQGRTTTIEPNNAFSVRPAI